MILWLDAQLSPMLAKWINSEFSVVAVPLRDIGLRDAEDIEIFNATRLAGATIVTKDSDFAELVARLGSPPQVIWVTCGNTSNARMCAVFRAALQNTIQLLEAGEDLVEIGDVV